jgi:hypothetical protein
LQESLKAYRGARDAWADLAAKAREGYVSDITFGRAAHLRGHWTDRLEAIDRDIAALETPAAPVSGQAASLLRPERVEQAIRAILSRPQRPRLLLKHTPPAPFRRGAPVTLVTSLDSAGKQAALASLRLLYRRINQEEPYLDLEMERQGDTYRAVLPGHYTDSPFSLQYFFIGRFADGTAGLAPGFNPTLSNQPYYVVHQVLGF